MDNSISSHTPDDKIEQDQKTGPESSNPGLLQPGQVIRPTVGPDQVPELVSRIFGLTTTSVKELNSYDDKNFHIKVTNAVNNPHITEGVCSDGYVFKILNSMDSKNQALVSCQNQMMQFLHCQGLCVTRPIPNVEGTTLLLTRLEKDQPDPFVVNNDSEGSNPREHVVRLLTFLPGKILAQVPYSIDLSYQSGVFLARMNNFLKEFHNEILKSRNFLWSLESTPKLVDFVYAVKEPHHRALIGQVLEAWNTEVVPVILTLDRGYIHGDFNEQNIIVDSDPDDSTKYRIKGLLDFGDIQYSCYAFEVAVAIMYQMVVEVGERKRKEGGAAVKGYGKEVIESGGHILAGYLTLRKVKPQDWNILKECVAARFAQSLVLGAYSYLQDPGNEYLLTTAAQGWSLLEYFWNTPKEDIINTWKQVVQSYQI